MSCLPACLKQLMDVWFSTVVLLLGPSFLTGSRQLTQTILHFPFQPGSGVLVFTICQFSKSTPTSTERSTPQTQSPQPCPGQIFTQILPPGTALSKHREEGGAVRGRCTWEYGSAQGKLFQPPSTGCSYSPTGTNPTCRHSPAATSVAENILPRAPSRGACAKPAGNHSTPKFRFWSLTPRGWSITREGQQSW